MLNVNLRTPYIRFDKRSGHAYLSFNHGKFASVYGIKKNDSIRLQREKKNGYREEYKAHQYKITDRRKDYGSDAILLISGKSAQPAWHGIFFTVAAIHSAVINLKTALLFPQSY